MPWQYLPSTVSDIALSTIAPATDETITANHSAYTSDYYEVANTFMLEVEDGAIFEVG